jgi:hypothetical protein
VIPIVVHRVVLTVTEITQFLYGRIFRAGTKYKRRMLE